MSELLVLSAALQAHLPAGARVRFLDAEDAPAVAAIAARLGQCGQPEWWRRRLEMYSDESALSVGVEVGGQVVAYMLGHVERGQFGVAEETAWLELLGVDPSFQGRGLARGLAEVLFDQLSRRGVRRVVTLVNTHDDMLRPFFRSLGFRPSQFVCLERRL